MRSVVKGAAPTNISPSGQKPVSFAECERDFLSKLDRVAEEGRTDWAREYFDGLDKRAMREALFDEQHHLCVYCESRVEAPASGMAPPVEHWRPLSASHRTALHWRNLYQSCKRDDCCDHRKGCRRLVSADGEDLPWPCEFKYEEALGVSNSGELYVRRDARLSEAQRAALLAALGRVFDDPQRVDPDATLNLNHPSLRAAREAAMDSERTRLERLYTGRKATREEREELSAKRLKEQKWQPFISTRLAYLRRQLGVGR